MHSSLSVVHALSTVGSSASLVLPVHDSIPTMLLATPLDVIACRKEGRLTPPPTLQRGEHERLLATTSGPVEVTLLCLAEAGLLHGAGVAVRLSLLILLLVELAQLMRCLLYTSDAADERSSVD